MSRRSRPTWSVVSGARGLGGLVPTRPNRAAHPRQRWATGCEERPPSLCLPGSMLTRFTDREQSTPIKEESRMSSARRQVPVLVAATSKWQADGRNTKLAHGKVLDGSDIRVGIRWGVGGAIAQKFAQRTFSSS